MNWDDPAARAALIERVGPEAYQAAQAAHHKASVVETVNGHPIRPVVSARFGRVFMVGDTGTSFGTLERAREFARKTRTPLRARA